MCIEPMGAVCAASGFKVILVFLRLEKTSLEYKI